MHYCMWTCRSRGAKNDHLWNSWHREVLLYLIHCLRLLVKDQVCSSTTGVAAFNVETHSLLSCLPKESTRIYRENVFSSHSKTKNTWLLRRCPWWAENCLDSSLSSKWWGFSCLLFGDFGQLPPVIDLPVYTKVSRNTMSDLGSTAYQMFNCTIVLCISQDRNMTKYSLLLWLRNGQTATDDWEHLMKCTAAKVQDL